MHHPFPLKLGAYSLLRQIAATGTSEIFLAEDTSNSISKQLAIKKLNKEFSYDKDFIRLMNSEYQTLRGLKHPHILSIYDFILEGENCYLVMEFVEGPSLRTLLDFLRSQGKTIPVEIALEITRQIASSLDYIHHAKDAEEKPLNLLHSDLHPKNILMSKEGNIKLIDFSMAQTLENKTGQAIGRGILEYMSPEQAKSESLDPRSDIFSTGVLLYEMLFNANPFEGKNPLEVYFKLRGKEITLEKIGTKLHEKLKTILFKCLAKNQENRYQTSADLELALKDYLFLQFPTFSLQEVASYLQPIFTALENREEVTCG